MRDKILTYTSIILMVFAIIILIQVLVMLPKYEFIKPKEHKCTYFVRYENNFKCKECGKDYRI